jgi:hypothetical protein
MAKKLGEKGTKAAKRAGSSPVGSAILRSAPVSFKARFSTFTAMLPLFSKGRRLSFVRLTEAFSASLLP